MGGGAAAGAFRKGASSLLETYHSDSLMARGPERCFFFFFKEGGGFDERREIQFSDSSAKGSDLVLVLSVPHEERGGHLEGSGRRSHEFALTLSKAGSYFRPR